MTLQHASHCAEHTTAQSQISNTTFYGNPWNWTVILFRERKWFCSDISAVKCESSRWCMSLSSDHVIRWVMQKHTINLTINCEQSPSISVSWHFHHHLLTHINLTDITANEPTADLSSQIFTSFYHTVRQTIELREQCIGKHRSPHYSTTKKTRCSSSSTREQSENLYFISTLSQAPGVSVACDCIHSALRAVHPTTWPWGTWMDSKCFAVKATAMFVNCSRRIITKNGGHFNCTEMRERGQTWRRTAIERWAQIICSIRWNAQCNLSAITDINERCTADKKWRAPQLERTDNIEMKNASNLIIPARLCYYRRFPIRNTICTVYICHKMKITHFDHSISISLC